MPNAALLAFAERLQDLCLAKGLTVATAESCTGGLVAATITAVPGSSGYFLGAVVSYADAVKASLLGVAPALLARHGAVSAEVARAMAEGCRARLGVTLAASVTGIAGPAGGSPRKPVGLAYLGLATGPGTAATREFRFHGDRAAIRRAAASELLGWLVEAAA